MLLQYFKVDGKGLFYNCIVIDRYFAQVKTDCVSLFQLRHQLFLYFPVFLKFSFFTKLSKLIMKLLRAFSGGVHCLSLAFVDKNFVKNQAV